MLEHESWPGAVRDRTQAWAREHGVRRAADGYSAVLDDPEVEAAYVPLPNPLHAEWAAAALEAGKTVLCEKPLTTNPDATGALLGVARTSGGLLRESFVFPFQAQHRRVVELIGSGAIGELREIVASFHFPVTRPENIRLSAQMFGGALADVGCYPMRLAHELFGSLRHIAAVLRQGASPVHLAAGSASPVASALGLAREAAGLPLDSSAVAGGLR